MKQATNPFPTHESTQTIIFVNSVACICFEVTLETAGFPWTVEFMENFK